MLFRIFITMSLLYYYEYDSLFSGYACVPVHATTRDPVREVEVDLPGLRPQRRRGHHEGQARGVFRISSPLLSKGVKRRRKNRLTWIRTFFQECFSISFFFGTKIHF